VDKTGENRFKSILMNLVSTVGAFGVKALSKLFYRTEATWITPMDQMDWDNIPVVAMLNHTSLFEPLFIAAIPNINLWRALNRLVVPVADVTLNRPIVGAIFKALAPDAVAITRKRDDSWTEFMDKVGGNSLVLIFPEGRMKRKDGLDKNGKPMNVKGGIADILERIDKGKLVIAYSGGLHHVQAPGELIPRLFKTIRVAIEQVDIREYKRLLGGSGTDFRASVVADLERRMKKYRPHEHKPSTRSSKPTPH
jgi:hypothetical protein